MQVWHILYMYRYAWMMIHHITASWFPLLNEIEVKCLVVCLCDIDNLCMYSKCKYHGTFCHIYCIYEISY